MEFWGVEVPVGVPTICEPGEGMYLHVSQAALGDSKDKNGKGNERVVLRVQVGDQEVVLGTLSQGKCDQMSLDLVFDREFKVYHTGTSGSVFICGYRTESSQNDYFDSDEEEEEDEDEDEPIPAAIAIKENGDAPGSNMKVAKPARIGKSDVLVKAKATAPIKAVPEEPKVLEVESDDDDSEDEPDQEVMARALLDDIASDDDDEDDEEFDEDDEEGSDDFDEDEDESEDEEELQIEQTKSGKKRPAGDTPKVSGSEKKSKMDTPAKPGSESAAEYWESLIAAGAKGLGPTSEKKAGGKKSPVTPMAKLPQSPASTGKKEAKTPGTKEKGKLKNPLKTPMKGTPTTTPPTTPASGKKLGDHKCTGCDRNFTTESALTQHSAAKHNSKK